MNVSKLKTPLIVIVSIAGLFAAVYLSGKTFLPEGDKIQEERGGEQNTPDAGAQAPYFDLPSIAGDHVKLSQFTDTPVLLVFWTTWNTQAADQIKILDDYLASGQVGSDVVHILAIDSQEEKSITASFLRRGGYKVPVLLDVRGATGGAYGVKSVPTSYFIGRDGTIRDTYAGVLSISMLEKRLEQIIQ